MSEEEIVQEEVKQEVDPRAEETTPAADAPVQEVIEEIVDLPEERKTIPKERFDQVWARTKHAEAELHSEREERIRLEERLKALEERKAEKEEPEYTWPQLEAAIAAGQCTREWAQEHREKVLFKKAEKAFEAKLKAFTPKTDATERTILGDLDRYKKAIPGVGKPGTPERLKYEREYNYLVQNLKYPQTYATQLAAVRAAHGDIDVVERAANANRNTTRETFMETHTPSKKTVVAKSFEETLSPDMKEHYRKLMKGGAIKMDDWKTVETIEKRRIQKVGAR